MLNKIVQATAIAALFVAPIGAYSQSKDGEYAFTEKVFGWGQFYTVSTRVADARRKPEFTVHYGVVNDDGKVSVCGTTNIRSTGIGRKLAARRVFENLRVQLNGKTILQDVSFFTATYNDEAFEDASVACQATDIDYPSDVKLSLRLDKRRYR